VILAIMQPYFFPYIGYWQLLKAADRFIIYDDVTYIKSGWINRNRILINGQAAYFTVPVSKQSSNKPICDISLLNNDTWHKKLLKMLQVSYGRAPYFNNIYPLLQQIIQPDTKNLSTYLQSTMTGLSNWLGINTQFVVSSGKYDNTHLSGQERIIDICKAENADVYLNLPGGMSLYDPNVFRDQSIELKFLCPLNIQYRQFKNNFIPHLSIIDLLMFTPKEKVTSMLSEWEYCL